MNFDAILKSIEGQTKALAQKLLKGYTDQALSDVKGFAQTSKANLERWTQEVLQKKMSGQLTPSGAALEFGPPEGPGFFTAHGWKPADVRSLLKTAAQLKRLSLPMRLLSMLPASNGTQGRRPWGGVCLLER